MLLDTKTKYLLLLVILGSFIFFFNLGERDLWDPDETRYAVVAREMRETGQWVLPRLNGVIYAEKPPLFFWMVNLSVFLLGEDSELANRLPSALAGFATILLTFFLGEKLFHSSRVGFLSAIVLGTCLFFPQLSRWMMLDSLTALVFLMTLFFLYLGYEDDERRRKFYLLAGLSMGFGVLTKGPLAWLPLPIFLIFTFFQRGFKKFWCVDLLLGFLLSLAIVLTWLIPACLLGGEDYTKRILLEQTVGRLSGNGKHVHVRPFFFYFIRFPIEFLPWIVFLPTAFVFAFRTGEVKRKKELLFLSVWFIFIFVFFTFSKGKKDNYILPLYPAAAMIMGWFWDSLISSGKGEREAIYGLLLLTCVILIALALLLFAFPEQLFPTLTPYRFWVISMLSYVVVGLLVSLLCLVKGNKWASFMCIVVTLTMLHLHVSYLLPERFNARRKTCLEEIRSRDHFVTAFRSPHRVFIVARKSDLDTLTEDLDIEVQILDQEKVYWDLVLISNR